MFGFLAPAALKLFFGGALKSVGGIFARLFAWLRTLNIWQIGCIALAVLLAVDHAMLIFAHRHEAKIEEQLLAANKALTISRANEATLRAAIAKQNAAVAALGVKTADEQKQAQDALGRAAQRVAEAKASSDRLAASARQRPPTGSCAPSKALQEQWQ